MLTNSYFVVVLSSSFYSYCLCTVLDLTDVIIVVKYGNRLGSVIGLLLLRL